MCHPWVDDLRLVQAEMRLHGLALLPVAISRILRHMVPVEARSGIAIGRERQSLDRRRRRESCHWRRERRLPGPRPTPTRPGLAPPWRGSPRPPRPRAGARGRRGEDPELAAAPASHWRTVPSSAAVRIVRPSGRYIADDAHAPLVSLGAAEPLASCTGLEEPEHPAPFRDDRLAVRRESAAPADLGPRPRSIFQRSLPLSVSTSSSDSPSGPNMASVRLSGRTRWRRPVPSDAARRSRDPR